ncbi:lactonase family protein [Nocardia harenae]|uniref:lactonase family protein n=1 Tax=Nocardia harenae TaxID=358707 RepID=UPI0012EE9E9D|nr:beta-propeller fold lactonase family protein [Nocardia harenae]
MTTVLPGRANPARRPVRRGLLLAAVAVCTVTIGAGSGAVQAEPRPERDQHIYVTSVGFDQLVGITVRPGAAPRLAGPPTAVPSGGLFKNAAVSPDGKYLYVGPFLDQGLAAFAINDDGTLTALPGSPVPSSGPVGTVVVAPDGKHLYVSSSEDARGVVTSFSIGPGGLPVRESVAQLEFSSHFGTMIIAPDGRNLYVAAGLGNELLRLPIGADGLAGAPVQRIPADGSPLNPAITPDGKHLYVANELNAVVSGYDIAPDGALSPMAGSPFATGGGPHGVTITPDGSRLYTPDIAANAITGFRIAPDGRLTPLPGSPFSGGTDPTAMPGQLLASRDGQRLYAVGVGTVAIPPSARLLTFDIAPDGSLRQSEAPLDTGQNFVDGPASVITP